jgi:hypothetical protein
MTFEDLRKSKVSVSDTLELKHGSIKHAVKTDSIGKNKHWSANELYHHLRLLEALVPRIVSRYVESWSLFSKCINQNEAAARMWINAFFFRITSMSPKNLKITLSVEHSVVPVIKGSTSFAYLIAILTSKTCAGEAKFSFA